ncbi:MAG TPA: hypothetical protein VK063_00090 [Beutenbergiaceae bacterium]|nr:hypothetical protein [Beutenbergiaceae bacterium]
MTEFAVQADTLELIRQLAERQADHMQAIIDHLAAHATLDDVGGLVMGFLAPMYHAGRDNAMDGLGQGQAVCDAVAQAAESSKQAYLDADEASRVALEQAVGGSDLHVPPPAPPGAGPQLPPATGLMGAGDASQAKGPFQYLMDHTASVLDSGRSSLDAAGKAGLNTYADHVLPRDPLPDGVKAVDQFRIRQPFDSMMERGTERAADWFWGEAESRWGNPGATSSLQERYQQFQYGAWGRAYEHGLQTGNWSDGPPQPGAWVDSDLTVRSWQTGQDALRLAGQTQGAFEAYGEARESAESLQRVRDIAGGNPNTTSHEWAQNR